MEMDFRKELAKELNLGIIAQNSMLNNYVIACEKLAEKYHQYKLKLLDKNIIDNSNFDDKEHYDSLIDCCTKLLDSVDAGKVPQRQIMGLRILLNRRSS